VLAGTAGLFLCAETHELAEEVVASFLYQVHLGQAVTQQENDKKQLLHTWDSAVEN
jgi:hypothetical protein